jgi:transposase
MSRLAPLIELTSDERRALQKLVRSPSAEHRLVERARIVLLADESRSNQQIAETLQTREARVSKWRSRFVRDRMNGLQDDPQSGKPEKYDESTERRILANWMIRHWMATQPGQEAWLQKRSVT